MDRRPAVVSAKWKVLGIRLNTKQMEQVEKAAASSMLTVSLWAKQAVLGALKPSLSIHDIPRTEPISDAIDVIQCQKCGHARQVRRKPQFNAPSLPGEDTGCPRCATGVTPKHYLDKPITLDLLYGQSPYHPKGYGWVCDACKVTFYVSKNGVFDANQRTVKLEPCKHLIAAMLPREAIAAAEAKRRNLSPKETIETCLTVGTGFMDGAIQKEDTQPSWTHEFGLMETMDPTDAMDHFKQMVAGRKLPKGFTGWRRPEQIAWLDKEMPL